MHFTCESCKASLNIADEKVKGKRLVVRCKRCGSRIQISDPALGMAAVLLGPQDGPAAAGKSGPGAPAAAPRPSAPDRSAIAGAGASGLPGRAGSRSTPAPAARAFAPERDREAAVSGEDTESTRAMDSEVLERALRASKAAEGAGSSSPSARRASPGPGAASAPARAATFPPLQRPAVPEGPPWFAMIAGKQLGPVTLGEMRGQIASGALGPRSYVWTEGMAGWVRAQEVPALAALFRAPPEAPRSAPPPPRAAPSRPSPSPSPSPSLARPAVRAAPARSPARPADEARDSPFDFGRTDLLGEDPPETRSAPAGRAAQENAPSGRAAQESGPSGRVGQESELDPELERDTYDPAAEADDFDPAAPVERPAARSDPSAPPAGLGGPEETFARAPASAQPAAKESAPAPASDAAPLELDDGALAPAAAASREPSRGAEAPESLGGSEAPVPLDADPGQAEPARPRRWLGARAGPLLLAAGGALLALVLLAYALAGRTKAPQAPAQAGAQDTRPAPRGGKPKGDGAAAVAVESPAVRDGQGPRAARGPGEAGLTADDVKRKLEQNKGALQRCIDEALRRAPRDPALRAGRIRITTTIAPTGQVIGTRIDKHGVDESPLGLCLKNATRRIAFPSFAGEPIDVDIPIDVTAGD